MDFKIRFQFLKRYTAKTVMAHAMAHEDVNCSERDGSVLTLESHSLDDMANFMRDMKAQGIIDSILCMEHLRLIDHARGDLATR